MIMTIMMKYVKFSFVVRVVSEVLAISKFSALFC